MDESSELYSHFKGTIDEVFHDIIWRNFRLFETDSEYFVFKKNAEYDDHSTPKKERPEEAKSNMFESLRLVPTNNDNNHSSNETYLMNLEGTKDSYSDSEEQTDNRRVKPNIVS